MEIKLSDYFPKLYTRFFPDFFNSLIDKEEIAICSNCIMLKPKFELEQQNYYSDKSKCCTFFPKIPNYLVGLILKDNSKNFETGRRKMLGIISKGVGVYPEGIKPGRKYSLLYEKGKQSSFGKSNTLICPFYVNNKESCSVWNGRSAVCSTFFCRYNAGTFGENFWRNIQFYLQEVEAKLSQFVILKLDAISDYFDHTPKDENYKLFEIDEDIHPEYSKIWGIWYKREVEFFIKSYEIISELTEVDFNNIMGVSNEYFLKKIKNAKTIIDCKELPAKLKLNNKVNIHPLAKSEYLITTPSGTFNVDSSLVEILTLFNGKQNLQEILLKLKAKGLEIETELLISFYHNQILVSAN